MPRHRLTTIPLIAAALALAACAGPTNSEPALPEGLAQSTVPDTTINAFVYLRPDGPFALESDLSQELESLSIAATDLGNFARRLAYLDASLDVAWSPLPTSTVLAETIFSAFWTDLQLAPTDPPASPIAAGFVRNAGDLLDTLIASSGVSVPNLSDAMALVRIREITFVAYSDDITSFPTHAGSTVLRDLDTSLLAIATSAYPAAVVGQVFEGFAGALGLTPIDIDGRTAHARAFTPAIDLAVLRQGPTLYFSITPTRTQTEALIASTPNE
jgi:hypothetical protein